MNEKIKCQQCGKLYSKYGIKNHIKLKHTEEGKKYLQERKDTFGKSRAWSKGLTKETDGRVKKQSISFSNNVKTGKTKPPMLGKSVSNETKNKISKKMKIAHAEGRANNWQDSKKYHNSSYPEMFFEKIIQNEFEDKNYSKEYRVGPYAIDFAWVDKMLAIEIDGQQHELLQHKENDRKKDELLFNNGWRVLRIKWIDMFHNTQDYIQIAIDFVHKQRIDYEKIEQIKKQQQEKIVKEKSIQMKKIAKQFNKVQTEYNRLFLILDIIKEHGENLGLINKLSDSLNVSHTQVRRILKKHNLDIQLRKKPD